MVSQICRREGGRNITVSFTDKPAEFTKLSVELSEVEGGAEPRKHKESAALLPNEFELIVEVGQRSSCESNIIHTSNCIGANQEGAVRVQEGFLTIEAGITQNWKTPQARHSHYLVFNLLDPPINLSEV